MQQADQLPHSTSTRRGGPVILACAAALGVVLSLQPAHAAKSTMLTTLHGCYLSVAQFEDDAERLRRYVPDAYELSGTVSLFGTNNTPQRPGAASFGMWTYSCDDTNIDGHASGRAIVTLVAVIIQRPDATGPELTFPANFDHYIVRSYTDNEKLARAYSDHGLPTRYVPALTFERTLGLAGTPTTTTRVPRPGSPVEFSIVNPVVNDTLRTHPHDNAFWYGDDPATATEMEITITDARDWFCAATADCGSASAPAGSDMAEFLGTIQRSDAVLAADHEKLAQVRMELKTGN